MIDTQHEEKSLISVIIPVYNSEVFLCRCMDSICSQTYTNLEIIVVNDGSTDNSSEILEKYAELDTRIQVICQKNSGVSTARNTGLNVAKGEFVLFLDSDDWLDKETCEVAIQTLASENADVVLWSYTREYLAASKPVLLFGEKSKIWDEEHIFYLREQFIGLQGEQLREPQKIDSIVTVWGKLYRKAIIDNSRFIDMDIIGIEDLFFNIEVFSKVKRAAYIPDTFSHYRKTNAGSLTHHYKDKLIYQWQELYRRIELHLKQEQAREECYQALNNRIALGLIGIGLNLVEDNHLNLGEKKRELKKILNMPQYRNSLVSLPLQYFPIHWRAFFLCAKKQWTSLLIILLLIMNYLRGR